MAADSIINKILTDAEAQAASIRDDGAARAGQAAAEADRETAERVEQIQAMAAAECEEAARRAKLLGKLEARKAELASRRQVLDDAFKLALEVVCKLDDATWEKLITRLVLAAAETGKERLRVNEKDAKRYAGGPLGKLDAAVQKRGGEGIAPAGYNMLAKLNAALRAKGLPGELTLDKQRADIAGGLMVISDISQTDCSFEALVADERRGCEKQVAELLFGAEV